MSDNYRILGIDIGSISISAVEMTPEKEITGFAYDFHNGRIAETLDRLLSGFNLSSVCGIAATSATPDILRSAEIYDTRISFISAAKHFHPDAGSILIVGGEKFGLVLFDEKGEYQNYRSNTSCAAGTGSFLDQQAARLNLSGIKEFSELAYKNKGKIPKIASRCAVFAKTDLIHAQQSGFSLEEICDGLSSGLVKNIIDTLFSNAKPRSPLVFCGGVSKNRAVLKHLSKTIDAEIIADEYSNLYGAIGAALNLIDDRKMNHKLGFSRPADVIVVKKREKSYHYKPLLLELSEYPDFESLERYEHCAHTVDFGIPIEVDIYEELGASGEFEAYLGIDIGSTSTKAALVDLKGRVMVGLYTRTSGRPVAAVQAIFECLDDIISKKHISLRIAAAGTTGSGRKFIGMIIGADLALDEITAHARAAVNLAPDVDTIIEIGGQDSKFTNLRNGMVTFSVMNHVCAAGTGSFIEEQAKKLGCGLLECADRSQGCRAPLSSDRCTVFMERDINYYLSAGYEVNEALASVLHSVRDNYLTKVAAEKNIGQRIFFQGATAKNRSLVAAFEQRLGRPIMVSKFCHLTGAIGAALTLKDQGSVSSIFRGIDLFKASIPVRNETCELCNNHCKLSVAVVRGETVAFGFLCGRDYDTARHVTIPAFYDMLGERKRVLHEGMPAEASSGPVVGIPAALHVFDDIPLWKRFFNLLGVRTITSEQYREAIAEGKNLTGAEFCAPIAALHGHINFLSKKADYVFLPYYMEDRTRSRSAKRNYCYYTQYSPSMVLSATEITNKEKILMPMVRTNQGALFLKIQLYNMIKKIKGDEVGFLQVSGAYDEASAYYKKSKKKMRDMFLTHSVNKKDICVVFLGRPYTILSRSMNNGIPEIFAKQGIKTFFQDMLPASEEAAPDIKSLMGAIHWKYAARILEATHTIAGLEGVYPVFVSSFKCTPDSYAIEYFKKIMDGSKKPYLILQLDEHDSSVGYETRIEAGIRSFRNHYKSADRQVRSIPVFDGSGFTRSKEIFAGRSLIMPCWDLLSCSLIEAELRSEGYDARIVTDNIGTIRRSMRHNTGQCIPLNIIIQNCLDYMEKHGLDPQKTVIWSPDSKIACNLGMFPYYTKHILESYGKGYENIPVYMGDVTFSDISIHTAINCYLAYLFGGMLRKIGCTLRPYETCKGKTDAAIARSMEILYDAFLRGTAKEEALGKAMGLLEAIQVAKTPRPKVAIFGDLYARDNDVMNQNLIKTIEDNGGEVITTPYSEYMGIIAHRYVTKWFKQGLYRDAALAKMLTKVMAVLNNKYYRYFDRLTLDRRFRILEESEDLLSRFDLSIFHTGESMDNILKIFHLIAEHPDIALFVQTNPSYCCPSLVTEAMADKIERITGIPIVTIEYDATGGSKNEDVIPYLKYPRSGKLHEYRRAI